MLVFSEQIRTAIRKLRSMIETQSLWGREVSLGVGQPCVAIEALAPMLETVVKVALHCPDEARTVGQLVCNGLTRLHGEFGQIYDILATITSAFGNWYPGAEESESMLRASWSNYGTRVTVCVGRWESEGGKYWVELLHGTDGWGYNSADCNGDVCGGLVTANAAKAVLQSKIDRGMFVPNLAFLPMTKMEPKR